MKQIKSLFITAILLLPSMSYGMMQRLGLQRMAQSSKAMLGRMQQNISAATSRGFAAKQLPVQAAMKTAALLGGAGFATAYANKQAMCEGQRGFETQTEAHMVAFVSSAYGYCYPAFHEDRKKYKDLVQRCVTREREKNMYTFYTSQPINLVVVQDVLRCLYELAEKRELRDDFIFLRAPFDPRVKNLTDVNAFLNVNKERLISVSDFDWQDDVRTQLISAQCALFGNWGNFGEDSFKQFLIGYRGQNPPSIEGLLCDIFKTYQLDPGSYLSELLSCIKSLDQKGSLLSISIPEKLVDRVVYKSLSFGIPHYEPIEDLPYNVNQTAHISSEVQGRLPEASSFINELKQIPSGKDVWAQFRILMAPQVLDPKYGVKVVEEISDSSNLTVGDQESLLKRQLVRDRVKNIVHKIWMENRERRADSVLNELNKLMLMPS